MQSIRTDFNNTYINIMHTHLGDCGGAVGDYMVEFNWQGDNPNPDWLRITTEATDEDTLNTFLNAHATLTITTDKQIIDDNGNDTATITCADDAIAGDDSLYYAVWRYDDIREVIEQDTEPVAGGSIELQLSSDTAGLYVVEIRRKVENGFESGYIAITVQESE